MTGIAALTFATWIDEVQLLPDQPDSPIRIVWIDPLRQLVRRFDEQKLPIFIVYLYAAVLE
jgi:hypothetical protein